MSEDSDKVWRMQCWINELEYKVEELDATLLGVVLHAGEMQETIDALVEKLLGEDNG